SDPHAGVRQLPDCGSIEISARSNTPGTHKEGRRHFPCEEDRQGNFEIAGVAVVKRHEDRRRASGPFRQELVECQGKWTIIPPELPLRPVGGERWLADSMEC